MTPQTYKVNGMGGRVEEVNNWGSLLLNLLRRRQTREMGFGICLLSETKTDFLTVLHAGKGQAGQAELTHCTQPSFKL